ncbi:ATP-binding cassette domain-containing protein [Streptococcus orisasini]|uniref:ATP-binding cassette domain-containing protein n=1 Tax=Streptococcus orisasini TaxID=1080071 RepID=UPI000A559C0A|nr:ABC transporter ATP-binding protein [Streptococcus orisasini]
MIGCFNIIKSFHGTPVIKGISIEIKNGMITSIVGKNGAGKSTLIGLIMDYYRCDSGEVKKGTVPVMPDADNMYSDWTGLEFLEFIARLKKTDVSYAVNLSKELGLYKNLKGKISGYSFGMKKKLSFIQCAVGDFDAYIFDEPTSGVDVPSALIMMDIIKRLKTAGAAILLTSHNIDELERVSDYVYAIDSGTVKNLKNPDSTEKEVYNYSLFG